MLLIHDMFEHISLVSINVTCEGKNEISDPEQ